jgi:hypothetical protein
LPPLKPQHEEQDALAQVVKGKTPGAMDFGFRDPTRLDLWWLVRLARPRLPIEFGRTRGDSYLP